MRFLLPLLGLTQALACAAPPMADVRFTASSYETVLERTVQSLERYGTGIQQVDASRGLVRTKWKDSGVTLGRRLVFYRLVATVLPLGGSQADVRLSLETVQCSLMDVRDPERLASECAAAEAIPDKVEENFRRAAKSFELDLARGS